MRTISICYRKIIDSNAVKPWEKLVWEDTYTEFLMQAQYYNQDKKYTSFAELILNVPNADKLHFLVSAVAMGYLRQLNGIVPDILNILGKHFLPFKNFQFEIINSDVKNKALHQVGINFYSEPLLWHDTIGNNLLVSVKNQQENENNFNTELLPLLPFMSISSLKNET